MVSENHPKTSLDLVILLFQRMLHVFSMLFEWALQKTYLQQNGQMLSLRRFTAPDLSAADVVKMGDEPSGEERASDFVNDIQDRTSLNRDRSICRSSRRTAACRGGTDIFLPRVATHGS
jgi:hypothetical protein